MSDIMIIQRNILNYRKGFFDLLSEKIDYKLIASNKNVGKFMASKEGVNKKYIHSIINWKINEYIIFPFLFFTFIKIKPKHIITEGGQNTINNISVWLYCRLFSCEYSVWDLGKGYIRGVTEVSFARKMYSKFYNFILNGSKQIYTYHDKGVEHFISQGYQKRIIALKNTIDTREVELTLGKYYKEEQKKIDDKFNQYKYHILYVGAINENKNLEDMKIFMDMLPDNYAFIIVGSGDENYISGLKNILGEERVYFEGYKNMEELQYYYNFSDFLLLPGLGGLSINQAMAFGLPVVCTFADGIEDELIIENETGYKYTTIENAVDFIGKKDKNEWNTMGEQAKILIFENYTIEKMADRFVAGL